MEGGGGGGERRVGGALWCERISSCLDFPQSPPRLSQFQNETKVEELQRELWNTIEALDGERAESKRLKEELVACNVERNDLRDEVRDLRKKALEPKVSTFELNEMVTKVESLKDEAAEREKEYSSVRDLLKKSERRCEDMERSWLAEQNAVEVGRAQCGGVH